LRGEPWPRGREWLNSALVGILLPGIGNSAVTLGETHVASGLVALLLATIPLWMAGLPLFGRNAARPQPQVVAGLLLGFGGTALLIGPGLAGSGAGPVSPLWALIPMFGAFTWGWGSLWSRGAKMPSSPMVSTGFGLVAAGALVTLVSGIAGEWGRLDLAHVSAPSLWALAYLSTFGTVVAFTAYLYLLRRVSPALVSTYAFVNPIVAMVLGTLFLGEAFTGRTLIAAALVLASVVLILSVRARVVLARPAPQSVTSTRAAACPEGVSSRAK
jgi:drug/metabolite transporter (DMT)-like permease